MVALQPRKRFVVATISFETLSFQKVGDVLKVTLLNWYNTDFPVEKIDKIGVWKVVDSHTLEFDKVDQKKAEIKFSYLISKYFENLKTTLTGNKATYVHRNSGIPLLGNVAFGIVYRESSIIEIKPMNGCNLDCVYCSISEGLSSQKNDFVVEKNYVMIVKIFISIENYLKN